MRYVAHIITAEAVALGDPEVAIMTQANDGSAAVLVARYDIFDSPEETLADHDYIVNMNSRTDVETGYYIYDDVTRQDADVPEEPT